MRKVEYVTVDWNDIKSIEQAEAKKWKLENKGYTLIREESRLFSATLVYKLED